MSESGSPLRPFGWPSGVGDDEKGVGRHREEEKYIVVGWVAFLLSGGSVFVCGLSLPGFVALVRWLWGGSFLLARALLAPRGGRGRFLPLCRRVRPLFLSFGLVVRLAPLSFGVSRCGGVWLFPFFWLGRPPQKGRCRPPWGGCVPPSWRGGLRVGGGGRGAFAAAGGSFLGWVAFLRGAWVPLGFRFPLAALAGWRFFFLGRRVRAWFLSFGLVVVAALGGRKAPPPRPPPPPLRCRVVGCWRPPLFWLFGVARVGCWGCSLGVWSSPQWAVSWSYVGAFRVVLFGCVVIGRVAARVCCLPSAACKSKKKCISRTINAHI